MITLVLILLGLCFGSFVNALVWRVYKQSKLSQTALSKSSRRESKNSKTQNSLLKTRYSIIKGRSMCVHCEHELGTWDLIPIASWVMLGGKCRYCKKPISWQYPAVEAVTALIFVLSYIYWPYEIGGLGGVAAFIVWLTSATSLMALLVYDLRWMILPNRIVYVLYIFAVLYVLVRFIAEGSGEILTSSLGGAAIGGGIFYLLFQVSKGAWIGGGDVKLGFALGALAGAPSQALLLIFLASLLGSLYSLPLLLTGKAKSSSRIPFGPFLILATFTTVLFGANIIDFYNQTFLYREL